MNSSDLGECGNCDAARAITSHRGRALCQKCYEANVPPWSRPTPEPSGPDTQIAGSGQDESPHAILAHPDGRVQAVKQGFCWPAFCFTWFWATIKGLPVLAIEIFVIVVIIGIVLRLMAHGVVEIFLAVLAVLPIRYVVGREGNRIRQKALLSEGFKLVKTVIASDPKEALAKAHASTGATADNSLGARM